MSTKRILTDDTGQRILNAIGALSGGGESSSIQDIDQLPPMRSFNNYYQHDSVSGYLLDMWFEQLKRKEHVLFGEQTCDGVGNGITFTISPMSPPGHYISIGLNQTIQIQGQIKDENYILRNRLGTLYGLSNIDNFRRDLRFCITKGAASIYYDSNGLFSLYNYDRIYNSGDNSGELTTLTFTQPGVFAGYAYFASCPDIRSNTIRCLISGGPVLTPSVTLIACKTKSEDIDNDFVDVYSIIRDFTPYQITCVWYINDEATKDGVYTASVVHTSNGKFTTVSRITMPMSQFKSASSISCIVTHQGKPITRVLDKSKYKW